MQLWCWNDLGRKSENCQILFFFIWQTNSWQISTARLPLGNVALVLEFLKIGSLRIFESLKMSLSNFFKHTAVSIKSFCKYIVKYSSFLCELHIGRRSSWIQMGKLEQAPIYLIFLLVWELIPTASQTSQRCAMVWCWNILFNKVWKCLIFLL